MKQFTIYMCLLFSVVAFSQEKDNNLPDGNKSYIDKNYVDAEADYRISASKFPKKAIAASIQTIDVATLPIGVYL